MKEGILGRYPAVYSPFIHVVFNDLDRPFESLHQACDERSSYLIFLNVQPFFERLRAAPSAVSGLVRPPEADGPISNAGCGRGSECTSMRRPLESTRAQ